MICGKNIFQSRTDANNAIEGLHADMKKGHYKRSKKQPKVSYFCEDCNGWHISTGTKKKTYVKNKTISLVGKNKKQSIHTHLVIKNFNK